MPMPAVLRICLPADEEFARVLQAKARYIQPMIAMRSIFDGVELRVSAGGGPAPGSLIAIGGEADVIVALNEGREAPASFITMFEDCGTRCIIDRDDSRRVGLIVTHRPGEGDDDMQRVSQRLSALCREIEAEYPPVYFQSFFGGDPEETTEMALTGILPAPTRWTTEMRIELVVQRFLLEVAEFTWQEQAAEAADNGIELLKRLFHGHAHLSPVERQRMLSAVHKQFSGHKRMLARGTAPLEPLVAAADGVKTRDEAAALWTSTINLAEVIRRVSELDVCKRLMAWCKPGNAPRPDVATLYQLEARAGSEALMAIANATWLLEHPEPAEELKTKLLPELIERVRAKLKGLLH